jgi:Outer membrane protein beta-barrel domain
MKNILFLFACILLVNICGAQINKGSSLLGLSFNLSNGTSDYGINSNTTKGFTISPSYGYAIRNNKVVGITLDYVQSSIKGNQDEPYTYHSYGAGAFIRKYLPLGKGFHLYGEGTVRYNYSKAENNPVSVYSKSISNTFGVDLTPGISYALSRHFQLEAGMNSLFSMNYSFSKTVLQDATIRSISHSQTGTIFMNAHPVSALQLGFRFIL